ncbi:MAG: hypothetical protein LBM77_06335 [Spirochaetaceae bacterium]|jgi:hypothetical protein|nr:hypothetical protein [Spirochaetaceae bacterium]
MEEQKKNGSRVTVTEQQPLKGILRYTIFKNGVPIEKFEDKNLIVDGARLQMAHLIAGDTASRSINRISVGTNGNAPAVGDTAITGAFTKAVTGFTYPANGQVQVNWKLETSEANGMAIREFGLICANGTLFARRIRANPIYKESDISIEGEWIIIF